MKKNEMTAVDNLVEDDLVYYLQSMMEDLVLVLTEDNDSTMFLLTLEQDILWSWTGVILETLSAMTPVVSWSLI